MKLLRKPQFGPRTGAAQIGMMILATALSWLAGKLLAKKNKSPIEDNKPTTLSARGSYTNYHIGIREVGPVVGWANDREKKKEKADGGKGFGGGQEVDIWYEAGWHILGPGPCHALIGIKQAGTTIWTGRITPESHPSGSTVNIGAEGSFQIYWGEIDQPLNTFLGDPSRVGITGRWPFACYVVWNKKRLGQQPIWPTLHYHLERRPSNTLLIGSQGWYEPDTILDGPIKNVTAVVASAIPTTGYLQVSGDFTQEALPDYILNIIGAGLADGDYEVLKSESLQIVVGTSALGFSVFETVTRIFLTTGTLGATATGTVQSYSFDTNDGANAAHVAAEILFADYPQGLELDPEETAFEPWDIDSLEEWGVEVEAANMRSSIIGTDGETAQALLGGLLQDHSVMLPLDTESGQLTFARVRFPEGDIPDISDDHQEVLPETETLHGIKDASELVFKFSDRDNYYADMTIAIDEDGKAAYTEWHRAKTVDMPSTTHFPTASQLAETRSQEELAGGSVTTIKTARQARDLIPGDACIADGFRDVLRVIGVKIDPLSETVQVKVATDFYGAPKSDFENEPGGIPPPVQAPDLDLFTWLEVPEQLLSVEEIFLMVPRVRAHTEITNAGVHISRDNGTYTFLGLEPGVATGGTLDVELDETSKTHIEQGPTFQLYGDDAALAQDLSADPINFGLGRQLCVISSLNGVEICFVEKITAVGGSQYRLDGLLRARYDTRKVTHAIGATVYVFNDDTLTTFQDALLEEGEDLYVKTQPNTLTGSVSLAAVPPVGSLLYGKGMKPIAPENLRCSAPFKSADTYRTGDDVTVRWSYSSAETFGTGAGFQNAGDAIGEPNAKGNFLIELRTAGGTLVSSTSSPDPEVTFTAAQLAAAPISNNNFQVRVKQRYKALDSTEITLLVTHI